MYTIIGNDGKPYGPVELATLRQWAADGRINGDTSVQAVGSTEWMRLAVVPELASGLGVPPVSHSSPPVFPPVDTGAQKTSGFAITSLVLGIASMFCNILTGIPGLIFGFVSLSQIRKSNGQIVGKGLAITGICLSLVMSVGGVIMICGFINAMKTMGSSINSARGKAQTTMCMNNVKQIGLALAQYSNDYGDHLPEAEWCDRIMVYAGSKRVFQCPQANQQGTHSYAFNNNMLGQTFQGDPEAVLVVESVGLWNGTISGPESLIIPPHPDGWSVLFNDGHVAVVPKEKLPSLHWIPVIPKDPSERKL